MSRRLSSAAIVMAAALISLPGLAAEAPAKKPAWKKLLSGKQSGVASSPAVVGVRGLDEHAVSTDSAARDYDAVKRLELIRVSTQDLQAFIQEGNLR
jgi:hypothetical protein